MVDGRVLVVMLEILGGRECETDRVLVRMLVNMCYTQNGLLDVNELLSMCSISSILSFYLMTHSLEAQNNLFVLLFDFVGAVLSTRKNNPVPMDQISIIFELLKRFDAPHVFPHVFRLCHEKFVEQFVRFVFFDKLKKDSNMTDISARLDKTLMVAFLYEIARLSQQQWAIAREFESKIQSTLTTLSFSDTDASALRMLVFSSNEADRRNGNEWLFRLLHSQLDGINIPKQLDALFSSLVYGSKASARLVFVCVVERLILHQKAKITDENFSVMSPSLFKLLNEYFLKLVLAQEEDERVLLEMFAVILRLISVPAVPVAGTYYEPHIDSLYHLMLEGLLFVPYSLLQSVNIAVLHHIFSSLAVAPQTPTISDARCALLILISEKCRTDPAVLESVGGAPFFRSLLANKDPKIALFASRFLIHQLSVQSPKEYQALLGRAKTKEEQSNSYLLLTQYA
eukprot:TRINITY_DN2346_c0_g1_i1.p1 TRINITY_DN2346_c0_g1~~TRINITY_DN2346_c0_g1_i1.p1  ORF type:complete len:456 (+),score=150.17 TRINITY_DN2346_c0_g1_i1:151-1518(+)